MMSTLRVIVLARIKVFCVDFEPRPCCPAKFEFHSVKFTGTRHPLLDNPLILQLSQQKPSIVHYTQIPVKDFSVI